MIRLRKMNVVKEVDSEDKAKRLEAVGFKRISKESEKGSGEKVGKPPSQKKTGKKNPDKGGMDDGSSGGTDNSGGNGQPQDG